METDPYNNQPLVGPLRSDLVRSNLTEIIRAQLPHVLVDGKGFNLPGEVRVGKVRDSYIKDGRRLLVTTDRLSCFDRVVTTIPFKGQVLTQLAAFWLELAKEILPTHLIRVVDPNIMECWECQVLPVEVVVRGYLAGGGFREYSAAGSISGVPLPAGLREFARLPEPVITPTTKAQLGLHDSPISEEEICGQEIISPDLWRQIKSSALRLFELGSKHCEKNGLILADTKYEFGLLNGELILVDELHTLDSSRFWVRASYQTHLASNTDTEVSASEVSNPEMLDKEPMRQWLIAAGFSGDGELPEISDEKRIDLALHYISAAERIMGQPLRIYPTR